MPNYGSSIKRKGGNMGASKMFKRRKMPGMAKVIDITSKFLPTPKSGVISTIESPAKKFVDIRSRVKKAGGYAMGGEAGESLRKGTLFKDERDRRRKEVDEMLDRVYGTGIKPKKKPKNPNRIKPQPKKKSSVIYNSKTKKFRTGSNPGNNEKIVKID